MRNNLPLFLMLVLCATTLANSAFAMERLPYCQYYASTAVRAGYMARQHPACRHYVWETPARWTLNYGQHFDWCLSMYGSGQNASEHQARNAELVDCGAL